MLCNPENLLERGYEMHASRHRASGWRRDDGGAVLIEVPYDAAVETLEQLRDRYHVRNTPTARILTPEPRDDVEPGGDGAADAYDYVLGDTHMTVRAVADALDATLSDVCRLIKTDYLTSEWVGLPSAGRKRLVVYDANLHALIEKRS